MGKVVAIRYDIKTSHSELNERDHTSKGYIIFSRETYQNSKTWKNLNPTQKVIMITLIMMANHKDGEWFDRKQKQWIPIKRGQLITSLNHLTEACGKGVTIQNIRTALLNLEKMGFLTNKSTKQYRLITLVNYDFYQCPDNYLTKQLTKHQQSSNKAPTTNNNDNNENNEKDNIPYSEIIDYLNKKAGTRYKAGTKVTKEHIGARWKEGFRLDDFYVVIDKKVPEWRNDPKMTQYIRPQTLFGTKFEGYLNQQSKTSKQSINNKLSQLEGMKE